MAGRRHVRPVPSGRPPLPLLIAGGLAAAAIVVGIHGDSCSYPYFRNPATGGCCYCAGPGSPCIAPYVNPTKGFSPPCPANFLGIACCT